MRSRVPLCSAMCCGVLQSVGMLMMKVITASWTAASSSEALSSSGQWTGCCVRSLMKQYTVHILEDHVQDTCTYWAFVRKEYSTERKARHRHAGTSCLACMHINSSACAGYTITAGCWGSTPHSFRCPALQGVRDKC